MSPVLENAFGTRLKATFACSQLIWNPRAILHRKN